METKITLFSLLILLLPVSLLAQEISIEEIEFSTSIEDHTPVNVDTTFSADVGSVYCFTKVANVSDTTTINHVWYYNDEEKARISLQIKSESWRTWSSKKILPEWTGEWKVDVVDASGNVLATKRFIIQ